MLADNFGGYYKGVNGKGNIATGYRGLVVVGECLFELGVCSIDCFLDRETLRCNRLSSAKFVIFQCQNNNPMGFNRNPDIK